MDLRPALEAAARGLPALGRYHGAVERFAVDRAPGGECPQLQPIGADEVGRRVGGRYGEGGAEGVHGGRRQARVLCEIGEQQTELDAAEDLELHRTTLDLRLKRSGGVERHDRAARAPGAVSGDRAVTDAHRCLYRRARVLSGELADLPLAGEHP